MLFVQPRFLKSLCIQQNCRTYNYFFQLSNSLYLRHLLALSWIPEQTHVPPL